MIRSVENFIEVGHVLYVYYGVWLNLSPPCVIFIKMFLLNPFYTLHLEK